MKKKLLYINTIGCQMNVYDTSFMIRELSRLNYEETTILENSDLVIVNTCTIRDKAEQKAFSFLGRLSRMKKKKPALIIGVGGCVAQQEGKRVLKRAPLVDIVFGTHAVGHLAKLVQQFESTRRPIVDVEMATEIIENQFEEENLSIEGVTGFVTIMRGCDNYCTYCVVPYVRGRETSRRPENIISEIKSFVKKGLREVTLLGQNVNSYGLNGGKCSFPELLQKINNIDGLQRIRFATSHPKDLSDELIFALRDLEKLCNHMHLPVQSGSNKILEKMNRKYSRELYLKKVDKLRTACPDIAITTDIITGFPGETESDFQQTLDLIKTVEFDSLFGFIYSDRPNAIATGFSDKISEKEKRNRLNQILDLQKKYSKKKNMAMIGKTELILVEGLSKMQKKGDMLHGSTGFQWSGRTSTNKIVNFFMEECSSCNHNIKGEMIEVIIEKAFSHSLWGKPKENENLYHCVKGEKDNAA